MVKQNGYEESMWPLALCTAVIGTKLENIVALSEHINICRRTELSLLDRPEEIWNELVNAEQAEGSFRQFCIRI